MKNNYKECVDKATEVYFNVLAPDSKLKAILDNYKAKPMLSLLTTETIKELRDQVAKNSNTQSEYISFVAYLGTCLNVNNYDSDTIGKLFTNYNHKNSIPDTYSDVVVVETEVDIDIKILYLSIIYDMVHAIGGTHENNKQS